MNGISHWLRSSYYPYLKAYLSLKAAARLGCPIIGSDHDLACRQRGRAFVKPEISVPQGNRPPIRGLAALSAALGLKLPDFPLTVGHEWRLIPLHDDASKPPYPVSVDEDIDKVESARRLDAFLAMRRAPYFKGLQAYLVSVHNGEVPARPYWLDQFKEDWLEMGGIAQMATPAPDSSITEPLRLAPEIIG